MPTVISPKWLSEHGLISEADALATEVTTRFPNDLAVMSSAWFELQVQPETLQLGTTQQDEFERLRDLAIGILRSSATTKALAMGVNRVVHVQMDHQEALHMVGDTFANDRSWHKVLPTTVLRQLTTWSVRPDHYGGRIQIQIEPSVRFSTSLYIAINDHFDLTKVEVPPSSRDDLKIVTSDGVGTEEKRDVAIQILANEWSESLRRAEELIHHIVSMGRPA